ncbi:hypothetical protein D3C76_1839410 [compost metagenome]|jgi:hypothetical protein
MVTPKPKKKPAATKAKGRPASLPLTAAQMVSESHEQRIPWIYDMTPEETVMIMRKAGLLTASGKLKRCYR